MLVFVRRAEVFVVQNWVGVSDLILRFGWDDHWMVPFRDLWVLHDVTGSFVGTV